MINSAIQAIINNNDVDINIQECFDEIFSGISNPTTSGIFLSLLNMQEYSVDDVVKAVNSARNAIKQINLSVNDNAIENICLNPKAEYVDISFAMDIISSACDVPIVKSCVNNPFINNVSFDSIQSLGVDIAKITVDYFEKNNFLYSNIQSDNPYIKYTRDIIKSIPYETILNIVDCFLNPYNVRNCTVGVCNARNVERIASICLSLGYHNSIIFSSGDFPYVSIQDETFISEAWKNKIFSYTLTPELLEIKPNSLDSILVDNSEHNIQVIKEVFSNKLKDSYYDVIVINSALSLYITKRVKSLVEGINLAKKTIDNGKALEKLDSIKNTF